MKKTLLTNLVLAILFSVGTIFAQQNVKVLDLTGNTYSSGSSYYVASSSQMDVTGTWTFEGWLYVDSRGTDTYPVIMDRRTVFSWYLIDGAAGGDYTVRFVARDGSDNIIASLRCDGVDGSTATQMNFDTWYHIAVSRDGTEGVARLFINGDQKHSSTDADFVLSTGNAINYGARYWGSYSRYLDGALDEMHMSDVARYTSNFTISQSSLPQTADGSTVLLFNYDNSDLTNSATKNSYTATAHGTLTYSDWDALTDDLPLPVELNSLSAASLNGKVSLKWSTASEMNNQGFIIERSAQEAGNYTEIASYVTDDNLKGAGNSSTKLEYNYVDGTVQKGRTYWYKLVDVDMNGVRTEHGPVSVFVCINNFSKDAQRSVPEKFSLNQNYPNPFNPSTQITFDVPELKESNNQIELSIYDINGHKVRSLYSGYLEAGHYTYKWNGTDNNGLRLPSGTYIYQLKSNNFMQSKKLVLMK